MTGERALGGNIMSGAISTGSGLLLNRDTWWWAKGMAAMRWIIRESLVFWRDIMMGAIKRKKVKKKRGEKRWL